MKRVALVGDIVKFDGKLCKIVGVVSRDCRLCFELEYKSKFGLIPVSSVVWNGRQFVGGDA